MSGTTSRSARAHARPRRPLVALVAALTLLLSGLWSTAASAAAPGAAAFVSGPTGEVAASWAAFSFTSSGATSFQCALDSASFTSCTDPSAGAHTVSGLAPGSHTLHVRGVQGITPGTEATRTWTVVAGHAVPILSGPSGTVTSPDAAFTFGPAGVSGANGSHYECRLDSTDEAAWTGCDGYSDGYQNYFNLAAGAHTFDVRAVDDDGATGPVTSRTWTVAPDSSVTILSGPAEGSSTASTSVSFLFTAPSVTARGTSHYECRLDSTDEAAWGGCYGYTDGVQPYDALTDGSHTFDVRAVSSAGDVGPVTSRTWTVDTARAVTIVSGPSNGGTSDSTVAFTFRSAAVTGRGYSHYECRLDSTDEAAWTGCYGYTDGVQPYDVLTAGSHTFDVRAVDDVDVPGPATSRTWTVDPDLSVAFVHSLTTPLVGDTAAFTFTSPSVGGRGSSHFECRTDSSAESDWTGCSGYSSGLHTISGLAPGSHTLDVRAVDEAGNVGDAVTQAFSTAAPSGTELAVVLGSKPQATVAAPYAAFSWNAPGATSYECKLDAEAYTACGAGLVLSGLKTGSHTFSVRASDGTSTGSATSYTWTVAGTPATPAVTGPSGTVATSYAAFDYSAAMGQTYDCALDAGGFASCSAWAVHTGLTDGPHTFSVQTTDAAGNVSSVATRTWTSHGAPPAPTVVGPSGTVPASSAAFFYSGARTASWECSFDGDPYYSCNQWDAHFNLKDGPHTLAVRGVDLASNKGPETTTSWTSASAPPAPTVTGPSGTVPVPYAGFSFDSPRGTTFDCRLDGGAFFSCNPAISFAGLAEGSHTFRVKATDNAGNTGPVTTRTWTVAPGPAVAMFVQPPAVLSTTTTAAFAWTSNGAVSYTCTIDGGTPFTCASPTNATQVLTGLADGPHTFSVRATDSGANAGPAATVSFRVGTQPPNTVIDAAPSGLVTSTAASITFHATEPATFTCSLDSGPATSCTSPWQLTSLSQGPHTVAVTATDVDGNADPSPATAGWTVDTVAPTVTLDSKPGTLSTSTTGAFTFHASETATFECKLDSGSYSSCTSPKSYTGLADGQHTVSVRATDTAGNTGSATSYTWTVDATAPVVTIDTKPAALTSSTTAGFTFHASETATFECKLDSGSYGSCTSPTSYSSLSAGQHTVNIRATDTAGNTGAAATWTWTIDTTAPTVTVDTHPDALTNATTADFTFHASETATFECRLDNGSYSACTSPKSYTNLGEGQHTVYVRATDGTGATGAPATYTWTIDLTPPGVSIDSGPTGTTKNSDATLTFSSQDGTATFTCRLGTSGTFSPCTSPATYNGLADGSYTFTVRATDGAGNVSTATRTWTVDTVGPTVVLDDKPSLRTSSQQATFTWHTATTETGATFDCLLDGVAKTCPPASYAGLAEGSHTFKVRATDAVGNTGPYTTFTWTVDLTPPTVVIVNKPSSQTFNTAASFTYANTPAAPDFTRFECRLDSAAFATCPNSGKNYTGLAPGSHTFRVRGVDDVGNAGTPAVYTWTVLESPAIGLSLSSRAVDGTALSSAGLGDDFVYRMVLSNTGGDASDASMALTVSDGTRVLTGKLPAGCSLSGGVVTCAVGALAGGASVTRAVTVDTVFGCTIVGNSAANTLTGTTGNDVICGAGGADTIYGAGGNDTIYGYGATGTSIGSAAATWTGGSKNAGPVSVTISSADGADTVNAGDGADSVFGQGGNDVLHGDAGNDQVVGGDGDDTSDGGADHDKLVESTGDNDMLGGAGDDYVLGGGAHDYINGGAGDDVLLGRDGGDDIVGYNDDDYISGGEGADSLEGALGRDVVLGSGGNDSVDGGGYAPSTCTTVSGCSAHMYNRLYGQSGTDACSFGPGSGVLNTDYRDATCDTASPGGPSKPGAGWLFSGTPGAPLNWTPPGTTGGVGRAVYPYWT